jgi:hypothetical protein
VAGCNIEIRHVKYLKKLFEEQVKPVLKRKIEASRNIEKAGIKKASS